MALGSSDCLGIPTREIPISGCRLVLSQPSAISPAASVNTRFATFPTTLLNDITGAAEYIRNASLGDKILVKKAGTFSFCFTQSGSTNQFILFVKNIPDSFGTTDPETIFTGATTKPYIIGVTRMMGGQFVTLNAVSRLQAGDEVRLMVIDTGTYSANYCTLFVEYLGEN